LRIVDHEKVIQLAKAPKIKASIIRPKTAGNGRNWSPLDEEMLLCKALTIDRSLSSF